MSANAPQMVSVVCPACQTRYNAPVHSLIDVRHEPRLKNLLLQGRLNVGVCPSCGAGGMLGVPLAYHDQEKELLLCLVPQELRINETERQRVIGDMSKALMDALPPQERKGYLLRPRIFLTLQSLIEAVLEADGITREMLQEQRQKVELSARMLETLEDSLQLSALIGENAARIDREFFTLLGLQMDAAEAGQQSELLDRLTRLRAMLLERTEIGQQLAREEQALNDALVGIADQEMSREDLLDRIVNTAPQYEEQVLSVLLALARPLIDYQFFQLLTVRIDEASDEAQAARLRGIRTKILEITQDLDAQVRQQTQERVALLQEIMASEAPRDTVRAHIDEIDDAFMSVLAAGIAQNEGENPQVAQRLLQVRDLVVEVLQEGAPPELRFVSQLLDADYPDATRQMLNENRAQVTPQVLRVMESLAGEMASRGDSELSEKLNGILAQAKLML
jgi:hypothetical protein